MWPLNVISATGATVTLTGASILDAQSNPNDTRAAFVMGMDGFTYQEITTTPIRTVINSATDWVFPRFGGYTSYEVMVTNVGAALEAGSDALGVWLDLGTERLWSILTTGNNQGKDATLTVQVRLNGVVQDTGFYNLTANTGTPP